MSLILGVNLPQYLYLVSDTRLTLKNTNGTEYQDNFNKFYSFNRNLSVVVAGDAHLASFILRKIDDAGLADKGFIHFENKIEQSIKYILDDYMVKGGKYVSVVLIFAGFDEAAKKQINASQYGKVLSKTFLKDRNPIQRVDMNVIKKMLETAIKNGGDNKRGVIGTLSKDSIVETDYPYSSITVVEVHLPHKPAIKKVDCYKFIMKAPKGLTEDLLPEELTYRLECEQAKHTRGEETIKSQTIALMAWVNKIIKDHKLETVGGHILAHMVTPTAAIMMTGALSCLDVSTKEISVISDSYVNDGKFCVRDKESKKIVPLQNVYNYDFDKGGAFEL